MRIFFKPGFSEEKEFGHKISYTIFSLSQNYVDTKTNTPNKLVTKPTQITKSQIAKLKMGETQKIKTQLQDTFTIWKLKSTNLKTSTRAKKNYGY